MEEVIERWREYFERLLNIENNNELEEVKMVEVSVENVGEEEVERALKEMKDGNAPGLSDVSSGMLKLAGRTAIRALTVAF